MQWCVFIYAVGLPGGSDSKESACNAGDLGSVPGSGRSPGEGNGNPLLYSYSPWGYKELDTTNTSTVSYPLPEGDTSQDSQWIPETWNNTNPICTMMKFNL